MNDKELLSKIRISENGAICLDKSLVCDGFVSGYDNAAFTHIHSDHVDKYFDTCMHRCDVYTTKITGDLLETITGENYSLRTHFHKLNYKSPKMLKCSNGDFLTFFESKHMLGSGQIYLHTSDKLKIIYSGDISPKDQPPKCDILVIDSTHGDPRFDKSIHGESLENQIINIVTNSISESKPVSIHAHRGKLQHIMHLLTNTEHIKQSVPFLTTSKDTKIAEVYTKNGLKIGELTDLNSYDGEETIQGDYPWIEFHPDQHTTKREELGQMTQIIMMGGLGKTVMKSKNNKHWLASDEHAEFSGILDYVKKADPQVVITDGYRTPHGKILADRIYNKLGITAKVMPDI